MNATATIWDESTDGKFYGDIESHRETVTERLQAIHGPAARVQISQHASDRYSAQVFVAGKSVADVSL